ncbi:MAG: isoprenylcysteine carboxylmethyltransferase family protein [Bryobacteraceae bacterium]|nr:isoprenylcysteine carboxylmethyltransferase family protein [Bryobacteraceae bacterium]
MPLFPKRYADAVQRWRVPSGIALAAAFVLLADPVPPTLLLGLPFCLLGLALRAWAAGHLRKDETLTTTGPYAFVRNPLYLGSLTAALGCVIAAGRAELALLAGAYFLLVYLPVVEQEEQHLRELFPGFDEYARRVRAFLPTLPARAQPGSFSLRLYLRNREQRALYGFAAVYGFLLLKLAWRGM